MSPDRCDNCGAELDDASDCFACGHPAAGQPRSATAGSESATLASSDPRVPSGGDWDALILGTLTLVAVVAAVAWLV